MALAQSNFLEQIIQKAHRILGRFRSLTAQQIFEDKQIYALYYNSEKKENPNLKEENHDLKTIVFKDTEEGIVFFPDGTYFIGSFSDDAYRAGQEDHSEPTYEGEMFYDGYSYPERDSSPVDFRPYDGITFFSNGTIHYIGSMEFGYKHGEGKMFNIDGTYYIGHFYYDRLIEGSLYSAAGELIRSGKIRYIPTFI
jgi:hypothetical protein